MMNRVSTILVIGALLVVTAVLLWLGSVYQRRRRKARFLDRPPMSGDTFYETFYATSGLPKEVVLKVLGELERATGIPRTLLRPEDRTWEGENIDDLLYDSLETVELSLELEELEEQTGQHIQIDRLETVDDYIHVKGLLERQKMINQRPRKQPKQQLRHFAAHTSQIADA